MPQRVGFNARNIGRLRVPFHCLKSTYKIIFKGSTAELEQGIAHTGQAVPTVHITNVKAVLRVPAKNSGLTPNTRHFGKRARALLAASTSCFSKTILFILKYIMRAGRSGSKPAYCNYSRSQIHLVG